VPSRAGLAGLALLVSVALLCAPFAPAVAVALAVLFLAGWARLEHGHRQFLEQEFARYYEPPIARAADCLAGIARHGARLLRGPRAALDLLMCVGFLALIVAPIVLVKAVAKEGLGDPLGIALGLVLWDAALELANYPPRLAHYRGVPPPHTRPWIPIALFCAELTAFLVIAWTPDAGSSFLRSTVTGLAFMGVAHAVAIQSTVVAIVTCGRPLR
jgi:hypothetical protein